MATAPRPPQPGAPRPAEPAVSPAAAEPEAEETWSDKIKTIGGLVAVAIGVVAVTAITIVALVKNTATAGTIAGAGGGVIASIVGAYFGLKVGTDQARNAANGEREQASKAAVFAAHLPEGKAKEVLGVAESIARGAIKKAR